MDVLCILDMFGHHSFNNYSSNSFSGLYYSEKSLSVTNVKTRKAEAFYWTAILFSNTLGTAFGDFLADTSGLGSAGARF